MTQLGTTPARRRRLPFFVALVATIGALVVPATGAGARTPAQANAKCPLGALDKASGTVEIVMWHSMNRANEEVLQRLVDRFNGSQQKVSVSLVNQTTYKDTLTKYIAGLSTGDLPDLVQIEDTGLQQMIDTQSVLPAQACVKADDYDLSDHVERVVDYYTVEDRLWPMPFNVSNPIFYYDKAAFRRAGLDPEDPPATLDEVRAAAEQLKSSGATTDAGYGLKTDPWVLEQWLSKAGKPYVNNGNGRRSRATAVAFDTAEGSEVFTWMSDMVADGLAVVNPNTGPSEFNNLLGIRSGTHAMTIDTSAALGTISQILGAGEGGGVELGVAPMPGPTGKGGVLVGGAALYIASKTEPAKQAAAWEFAKFLNEADVQAEWSAGTGYVPIRESATESDVIQALWAQTPGFKVAYDQLLTGVNNTATAGPVIGNYQGVRDAVIAAEQSMFAEGAKPKAALKAAKRASNSAIEEYNSRVGA